MFCSRCHAYAIAQMAVSMQIKETEEISGQWGRRQRLRLAAMFVGVSASPTFPCSHRFGISPARLGRERPEHGGILDRLGAGGVHDSIGKFKPAARRGEYALPVTIDTRNSAMGAAPGRRTAASASPASAACERAGATVVLWVMPGSAGALLSFGASPNGGAHPGWAPPLRIESRTQCVGAGTMPLKTNFWMRLPSCTSVT